MVGKIGEAERASVRQRKNRLEVSIGNSLGILVRGPDFTLVYDAGSREAPLKDNLQSKADEAMSAAPHIRIGETRAIRKQTSVVKVRIDGTVVWMIQRIQKVRVEPNLEFFGTRVPRSWVTPSETLLWKERCK